MGLEKFFHSGGSSGSGSASSGRGAAGKRRSTPAAYGTSFGGKAPMVGLCLGSRNSLQSSALKRGFGGAGPSTGRTVSEVCYRSADPPMTVDFAGFGI
jgi:hypothetical protein